MNLYKIFVFKGFCWGCVFIFVDFWVKIDLLRRALRVEGSLFATVADQARDHGVAGAPLDLVHELVGRTGATLTAWPDLNGASTADNRVQREREDDVGLVVDLALHLPLADVLVATLARVLHKHELAVRADLLDAHRAFKLSKNKQP